MSDFNNRSQSSARHGDYVWQYEYYDDEEPVSFEGLKAHRCKSCTTSGNPYCSFSCPLRLVGARACFAACAPQKTVHLPRLPIIIIYMFILIFIS